MDLIITEKPSVAENICKALGISTGSKSKGYFEGGDRIVSWCYGHLIELAEPAEYGKEYKKWNYESLPIIPEIWKYGVKADTREQFEVLKTLMESADVEAIVLATDAGREGELIGRLVYETAGCRKPMKRLWISSMEEKAIREGFENLRPAEDYDNLFNSAKCRQEADWLVGINGTRLFSVLYGKTLKVGRVQTPTLAMLTDREMEITGFKKEPFYTVHLTKDGLDARTEKIRDKEKAEEVRTKCDGRNAEILSIEREEKTLAAPKLYDLTSLQRDANRLFGFTAKQTLDYTQSLYEKKLVTYPRTDSRYLTDDMEKTAGDVLKAAAVLFSFTGNMECADYSKILDSSKVSDHHAIIPTVEVSNLEKESIPETEMKILSLIAARLAMAVSGKHRYTAVKATIICEGEKFTAAGKAVTEKGWKAIEEEFRTEAGIKGNKDDEEKALPELSEGQIIETVKTSCREDFTKPPKHYTEDTLLSTMEKAGASDMEDDVERKGLGTPATRADIIEKLINDGFVKREKKQLLPTDDGMKLITVMPDIVKSPKLTAEWENALSKVAKGELSPDEFMEGIKNMVEDLVNTYHEVGDDDKAMFGGKTKSNLGECPRCGEDVISGKYGPYCTRKCGMKFGKAMGKTLTDEQVSLLLKGKKILLNGIKSKKGKTYDAFLTPKGISNFSYTDKNGQEISGFQFDYHMEFPD